MPDSLIVLAIDTAMGSCSACCALRGGAAVSRRLPMLHGHAAALVPMVQEVMEESGIGFAALDLIAVTTGPGSFTGIRTGLSTARALGLAHDIPVLGLTTLEVLARQAVAAGFPEAYDGICAAIDSRRTEVFFQFFGKSGEAQTDPAMSLPENIGFPKERRVLLVGDAAERVAQEKHCLPSPLPASGYRPSLSLSPTRGEGSRERGALCPDDNSPGDKPLAVDPKFLASLAREKFMEYKKAGQMPPAPQPFYLRPPDVTTSGNSVAITAK